MTTTPDTTAPDVDDGIGLEDFDRLDPDVRRAVQHVRDDLRAIGQDGPHLHRQGRQRAATSVAEMRAVLAAHSPEFYAQWTDETFEALLLLADTWDATEAIIGEQRARRADEHPDGKWSLDSLRVALAKAKPGTYGGWTNSMLAAMLRKEGVPVITIRIGSKTHKGVREADVDRLLAARREPQKGRYAPPM